MISQIGRFLDDKRASGGFNRMWRTEVLDYPPYTYRPGEYLDNCE